MKNINKRSSFNSLVYLILIFCDVTKEAVSSEIPYTDLDSIFAVRVSVDERIKEVKPADTKNIFPRCGIRKIKATITRSENNNLLGSKVILKEGLGEFCQAISELKVGGEFLILSRKDYENNLWVYEASEILEEDDKSMLLSNASWLSKLKDVKTLSCHRSEDPCSTVDNRCLLVVPFSWLGTQ